MRLPRGFVQLDKAGARILRAVLRRGPCSAVSISREVGLPARTVTRAIETLRNARHLVKLRRERSEFGRDCWLYELAHYQHGRDCVPQPSPASWDDEPPVQARVDSRAKPAPRTTGVRSIFDWRP